MNCADAKELWEGEPLEAIEASKRGELDRHVADCRGCRSEVKLLEAIRAELPTLAAPYRPRRAINWIGAAAAALLAVAYLFFLTAPDGDALAGRLGAHLAVSEAFCRGAESADARVVAAEWESSGLREATAGLDPSAVRARFGSAPAEYVETFRRVGALIEAGRPVTEVRHALATGRARELAASLRPSFGGSARVTLPTGQDEVSKFVTARANYYAGQTRQAETLFDLFCDEHPTSPYAADAAYWGAQCAKRRGDTKSLVEYLGKVEEPR